MKKYLVGISVTLSLFLTGCSSSKVNTSNVLDKSFDIEKGMKKSEVKKILVDKPTSKQRFNSDEIWKYEFSVVNEETQEGKYNNVIIKFRDGVVANIGSFSCDLPKTIEE